MKSSIRSRFVGALAALLAGTVAAAAQSYPSRPITMIVGFPPGGPTDTLARIVADGMKDFARPADRDPERQRRRRHDRHRQCRPRQSGRLYDRLGNWTSHVGSPAIYPLQYDVLKDLEPVAFLAAAPLWILGKNDLPPRTAAELIAWLKSNPKPSTFGTVGAGSGAHMCGFFFAQKTGAKFQYVPYRGAGPAMQDLMAGQIDLSCLDGSSTLANVQAGRMRAYAVMGETRWDKSPQTPTMIESGVPGLTISFWHGLWTTKGTPQAVIDRLDAAVKVGARRSGYAQAARCDRSGHRDAGTSDAGRACRLPQSRDRKMVADHQGGRHQGGIDGSKIGPSSNSRARPTRRTVTPTEYS